MITGSKILFNCLVQKNIKYVFGYSGGAILPVLNEFYNQDKIKFIMSRTELGGSFMAEGYAKSSKTPGVVMTTSGPGALNIITSLQNALSDGTPILALTGQVSTSVLGTQAFQESDVINISKKCTKWNSQILDSSLIEYNINRSFKEMLYKRHGPVLLDLPKNIMSSSLENKKHYAFMYTYPSNFIDKQNISVNNLKFLIENSERPVILAGQGIFQSNSVDSLRELSLYYNIPVTTTLLGLGIFDENHKLSLKMLGMHGSFYANMAVQNCDLLINFGSRFDDRIIGNPDKFAKKSKIVHIDNTISNINNTIKSDYYINADCKYIINNILKNKHSSFRIKNDNWINSIEKWKNIDFNYPVERNKKFLQGRHVLSTLNKIINNDKINNYTIVADVGAHQMWAAQFINYNYPKVKFITSGGLGSMGFAVPASIGVKLANNNDIVICVCGDGGFTMSMVEILTAIDNKINIKILIINNNKLQMVKMWQEMFYNSRIIATEMNNPPFEKVADSMGCKSIKIDIYDNLNHKLQEMLNYENGPIVVNVITDSDEPVLPMVIPGESLDKMILDQNTEQKFTGDAPC
jgi:acetolactate synthase-1/2/3 large subunit